MKKAYQKRSSSRSQTIDLSSRRGQRQARQFFSDHPQALLPLVGLVENSQMEVAEFIGEVTRAAIDALLELSAAGVCGERHQGRAGGEVRRHGQQPGSISLGTEKIPVRRPRLRRRGQGAGGEVAVPVYEALRQNGPLARTIFETMLKGVSTRDYDTIVPQLAEHFGVKRSSVSEKFVELSAAQLRELCERRLDELELLALYIDGIHWSGHAIIGVVGVDRHGDKHVLGIREGATENALVVKELLQDLVVRGLDPGRRRLFVIDGSKALRSAIDDVFGNQPVQRCRQHKVENVLGHLPKDLRPQVRRIMGAAYRLEDAKTGEAKLRQYADWLYKEYPGAAASLLEGLNETFTVTRLGLPQPLRRCLGSTNIIESSFSGVRRRSQRVTRWHDGQMILRWVAAGLLKTAEHYRKILGHRYLWMLEAALQSEEQEDKIAA